MDIVSSIVFCTAVAALFGVSDAVRDVSQQILVAPVQNGFDQQPEAGARSFELRRGFFKGGASYFPERQHKFDFRDFGAVGDGKTLNTKAFINAVYACSTVSNKGGSQLYIPPGRYLTAPFNLTDHMTLYLAHEATILATPDEHKWPLLAPLPSYGRGRELPGRRYSSFIHAESIVDVVIGGENGTIDGQGAIWWDRARSNRLEHSRGDLVEYLNVHGGIIANVTLINSPFWTVHPVYSVDISIRDVTIINPQHSLHTDGINPDSSRNILIKDVYILTNGDAIAFKSGWDQYGIRYDMPVCNVFVENVIARSYSGAGIAIGSEMSGGVLNVTVDNVSVLDSPLGVFLKTSQGRGGYVQDATFTGIYMNGVKTAFNFTAYYGDHPDPFYDRHALPRISGVHFADIVTINTEVAAYFDGLKAAPFQKVGFMNVVLGMVVKGKGFYCSNVEGWSRNVHPKPCPELRPLDDHWPFSLARRAQKLWGDLWQRAHRSLAAV